MARGFNYAPGASEEVQLAARPDLQRAQVAALAQSRNAVVRETIAARRDLALGQMVSLAHDRSSEVRAVLARNPSAAQSVVEHLAEDRHVPVLEALLENPAVPTAVVERLAFHRKAEVRAAASRRIDADSASAAGEGVGHPHAPELVDRAAVVDIATGLPIDGALALHPQPPAVRTAPVRGFSPPQQ